ncbi:MAG: glycoside hydrolase family 2, partial [Bacteroidales bacterium]|nr:glycoside hydrolase family 2 [Bacteroidales bacterium]
MKNNICLMVVIGLALLVPSAVKAQRKQSFDEGWRFHRGAAINAEAVNYDDSKWREVIVPHDFSMEPVAYTHDYRQQTAEWNDWQVGPFSRLSIGDSDSGQTIGGSGWYRKSFRLPGSSVDDTIRQKVCRLRFDGVYNQAEVWVNGKKAAMNVFGFMPFVVDLNAILSDKSNRNTQDEQLVTIAVRTVSEGLNCRWYAGSGIYRHVWLEMTDKLHLDEWDTYVDASVVEGKSAKVRVSAKVFNENTTPVNCVMKVEIKDADGRVVATADKPVNGVVVSTELTVKSPRLWSPDSPFRYTARVSLHTASGEHDALTIPFGIRTISFSADKGFLLNGKPTKLRGGCVHHDNGLLGTAAIDRAEVRKVELLKAQGYNAVRTSHNLPSEAFL